MQRIHNYPEADPLLSRDGSIIIQERIHNYPGEIHNHPGANLLYPRADS